jgi:hypothetical protein
MLKPITRLTTPLLLLAAALTMAPMTASAQGSTQRNQADNSKRCEVADDGAQARQGKAGDADMESTYSSCRLLDGYVGFGARTNDGTSETPTYGADDAMPDLRKPYVAGRTHSLGMLGEEDGSGAGNARRGKLGGMNASDADTYQFAQNEKFNDWEPAYQPGMVHANLPADDMRLLASGDIGGNPPPSAGGVGGGGSSGGIDSGRNTPSVPVTPPISPIPEPQTYLMMFVGLCLVAVATRRTYRHAAKAAA